jgi:hypothetical protein
MKRQFLRLAAQTTSRYRRNLQTLE